MKAFYDLTTKIATLLRAEPDCNVVIRPQDISENKQDLFPLATLAVLSAQPPERSNAITFVVRIEALDIVDQPEDAITDKFVKSDDYIDIMNAQLYVLLRVVNQLKLQTDGYKVTSNAFEAIYYEKTAIVAGWSVDLTIVVDVGDITAC